MPALSPPKRELLVFYSEFRASSVVPLLTVIAVLDVFLAIYATAARSIIAAAAADGDWIFISPSASSSSSSSATAASSVARAATGLYLHTFRYVANSGRPKSTPRTGVGRKAGRQNMGESREGERGRKEGGKVVIRRQ